MPECIVETSDGIVLSANGIDNILRWDGYASDASIAGVAPPYLDYLTAASGITTTEKPVLAGSGVGAFEGTYFAAVRFVDENGNYSDLSNFSDSVAVAGINSFDYSNLPVPTQPSIVRRQILRNTDGQTDTFYVDLDTSDLSSTSLSSTRDDDDLATQEAVPLFDSSDVDIANVYGMPPNWKPFQVWHQNRMHFLGVQPYTHGSVRVQNGSTTVYGQGTEWPATLAVRFIYIDGATQPYSIESVDAVNQTITLTEPYEGDELRYAAYSIKPGSAEDNTIYYSEPNNAEAVPLRNSYTAPQDGEDVTGGMNFGSYLYILKRRRMYRLTTRNDPVTDGRVYLGITRGCVNNRCWVIANETCYLLDEGGVYAFSSDALGEPASPQIQDFFRRDSFSSYRINWGAARSFHAVHSPQEEIIRWYVAVGEDLYPRHALSYCYTLKRWSLDLVQIPIASSCLGQSSGIAGSFAGSQEQVYLGTRAGGVIGLSYDGLDGITKSQSVRGKVSSSSTQSVTANGYSFAACVGATIAMVDGRSQKQVRVIIEVSGSTARIDRPWDILPGFGDIFQVGGVPVEYLSRQIRYVRSEAKAGRSAEYGYVPVPDIDIPQTIRGKVYDNYRDVAGVAGRRWDKGQSRYVSTTKDVEGFRIELNGPGFALQQFPGGQESQQDGPKTMSIGFDGVAGPERIRVQSILLNGVAD